MRSVKFFGIALCIGLAVLLNLHEAFSQCAGAQSFTVNPAPNGGGNTYLPGTVVTYCYSMNGYTQAGVNWVDGFEIALGPGWQGGSLLGTTPPANCVGGGGQWMWSNSVTGSNTGQVNGPGYFFDLTIDGNPGNDFGDAGGACIWTLCFQAVVGNTPGASLSVNVTAIGDGSIGSWTSNACPGTLFNLSTATVASAVTTPVTVNTPIAVCQGTGVNLTAAGAANFTWSPAAGLSATTGANVTATPAATTVYTVTGTGGCSPCTATSTVTINPTPTVSIAPAAPTICVGSNVNLTASGATTYTWSPAAGLSATTGANVSATPAVTTTYTVIGTSAGCTNTNTVTVTVVSFTPTVNPFNATCTASNGSANVAVVPAGVYTYSWNSAPVQTTQTANNLPPGNFTVTVAGPNGCTATASGIVGITNQVLTFGAPITTPAVCTALNGTAFANAGSGTGPYSYSWNSAPVQITQMATGLASGNYTVTATDNNGCTGTSVVNVPFDPGNLTISIPTVVNVNCNAACNGTFIAAVAGGTNPVGILWNDGAAQTTLAATNLCAANYQVTATDANGCTAQANGVVTQPTALTLNVVTTSACPGLSNGTATATPAGGTLPYNITWGGANPAALGTGNYTVTVTDGNGCIIAQNFSITNSNAISTTVATTDVSCNGLADGTGTLTINGGTAPFVTNWNGANPLALAAGNYSVSVADQLGCSSTTAFLINEPAVLTVNAVSTDVSCNGSTDGTSTLTINGGTTPYVQNWGAANPLALAAGAYAPSVTDANGCTASTNVVINSPTTLTATVAATDATCFGYADGTGVPTIAGGTAPYALNWNGANPNALLAGNYSLDVTDANGCTVTANFAVNEPTGMTLTVATTDVLCNGGADGTALEIISGGTQPYVLNWNGATQNTLSAGAYQLDVTDAQGCSVTQPFTINEPALLTLTVAVTDVLCFGAADGQATPTTIGGTLPYVYNWNGTNPLAIAMGNYTVDVTDANGCTASANYQINEPTVLTATVNVTDVLCFGDATGTATELPLGGTLPYAINWNGANPNALAQGNYSVDVTDANGCLVNVPFLINEPASLTSTIQTVDVSCFGFSDGTAILTVNGGVAPYVQNWSGANPLALAAGTYPVLATDANGCTTTNSATINEPTALVVQQATTDVLCNGMSQGTATLTISGGTPAYTPNWGLLDPMALPAGNHPYSVTDLNGCVVTQSAVINEPALLVVDIATIAGAACIGQAITMTGSVTGGVLPHTTSWLAPLADPYFIATGTDATTIAQVDGGYTLQATDANGCSTNFTYNMPVNDALDIVLPPIPPVCPGTASSFQLIGTGGNGNYVWNWSLGQAAITGNVVTPPVDTTMTITFYLTDNCTVLNDSISFTITTYAPPTFNFTPTDTSGCVPFLVPFADNTSPQPAQWRWEFNDTYQPSAYMLGQSTFYIYEHPGTYYPELVLTTLQGCEFRDTATVVVNPLPNAGFVTDPIGIVHLIDADFHFYDLSTGAVQWFYDFGDGDTSSFPNPHHVYTDTAEYRATLAVWNIFGCADTTQTIIKVNPDFSFYFPNSFTPNGDGINDGFGPKGIGVASLYMTIHDRWGEQLTELFAPDQLWDGTYKGSPVKLGVYGWTAQIMDINGAQYEYTGSVRLVR